MCRIFYSIVENGVVIAISGEFNTIIIVLYDERTPVYSGSGYSNSVWDVDCVSKGQDLAITYYAQSEDSQTLYYDVTAGAIAQNDVCDIDYSGVANGFEDRAGNDLAAIDSRLIGRKKSISIHNSLSISSGNLGIH